jgi:hypothetical protein
MAKENMSKELFSNVDKIHTTPFGILRIKNNLGLNTNNVVNWCIKQIKNPKSYITRKGKNWYVNINNYEITINANSYTIITAHKIKKICDGSIYM